MSYKIRNTIALAVLLLIIIGIGLFEAWKMNRKPDRTVTGPFRIESAR